ncbi:PucR family transcriptional regulator [Arthrobacter sp. VKM Ac-2550]|uniref:PucR family transcriptional regulator n=1 Tax=Crystallibacter permensis TaxID=1938888 RepID=UPI00222798E5|nr:PucR family transcriptional regulator ligand-binding domain-containing protein [Arthrobacter sp. VKM Ac-2550]MCW2132220.1 purine catabolism regulatory protein [Arthrobacter sp. VKM Ac-2550]
MAVSLASLLAKKSLHLRVVGKATGNPDAAITWVATTELEDPLPFLSGGEVVLTTGLRQKTAAAQRRFVARVHEAGVVAIGFALGLSHSKVPPAFLNQADELNLPVFEIPYETPFVAISRMVADAISADHYRKLERLLSDHQALSASLLGGGGLPALLRTLAGMVGTDVELSQYGAVLFSTGAGTTGSWNKVPIATGLKDRCTLALAEPYERNAIIDYAQSMISLELSNQAKHRTAQRNAAGQILQDIVRGTLHGQDATLRLNTIGVDTARRQLVMLVQTATGQRPALRTLPLPAAFEGTATGLVDDRLVLVVQDAESGERLGEELSSYLYDAGLTATVGVGGSYAQPNGLRWSYFEAKEALTHGARLNVPQRLSLTSLLMASEDVPLADLAAEALDPLSEFDAAHDAQLMSTLETYLELNGSVAAVAETLGLHRNSVRYRLAQIIELTGYDPASTADRVHLWLALTVRRLAAESGSS